MYAFEASQSVARTGTGSRREGEKFELLVATFWDALGDHLKAMGASSEIVTGPHRRGRRLGPFWTKLSVQGRSMYVPTLSSGLSTSAPTPAGWLDLDFAVRDLVNGYPGLSHAVSRYAPETGPYSGSGYEEQFAGLKTQFDDTIVLEEDGILQEKLLLEYKTAKSSKKVSLDGNAHERLSFQVLQYLEVATRFPACSLCVIANGAFAVYRNKYHVNFRIQADRLKAFRWFDMQHLCTMEEYGQLANRLTTWLFAPDQ